jgi:hypothetical protein
MALREEGEIPDFVYDEEQDLFRFPEDGRFAFSRERADVKLLEERGYFGWALQGQEANFRSKMKMVTRWVGECFFKVLRVPGWLGSTEGWTQLW